MTNFVILTSTHIRKIDQEISCLEKIESAKRWQVSRHFTPTPFRDDAINGLALMKVNWREIKIHLAMCTNN